MSPSDLLRCFIRESLEADAIDQSIVRRGDDGKPVIRKMITFEKPGSRFRVGDNVDSDVNDQGNVVVDDAEVWKPEASVDEPTSPRRAVRRLA